MIRKIKQWFERRRYNKMMRERFDAGMKLPETYSREQMEKVYTLGYTDGKRDGLAVAREQAARSFREITQSQNNQGA